MAMSERAPHTLELLSQGLSRIPVKRHRTSDLRLWVTSKTTPVSPV